MGCSVGKPICISLVLCLRIFHQRRHINILNTHINNAIISRVQMVIDTMKYTFQFTLSEMKLCTCVNN